MLKSLYIDNFAIISNLEINWSSGLNIVTGQTGAGKSIILGALSLLSGNKVDSSAILDQSRNLVVEGVFDIKGYGLEKFFQENDLDYSDEIVIRRQISPGRKSRCFVEDVPVSQTQLKILSDCLIDVHSQHQSLLISKENFQLDILDAISGTRKQRTEVESLYSEYDACRKEVCALKHKVEETERDADYLSFQIDQINQLNLKRGETAELEQRLAILENYEDIARNLSQAVQLLDDSENAICPNLSHIYKSLESSQRYIETLADLTSRVNSALIELKDVSSEVERTLSSLSFDPEEKQRVYDRLDEINTILSKHGVMSEDELLQKCGEMSGRLASIESDKEKLLELETVENNLFDSLKSACLSLSAARREKADSISRYVISTLARLGVEKARFEVSITEKDPSPSGVDKIDFMFSANQTSSPVPIGKAASGGEMSRVMLALKSLAAKSMKLPTIIFDEIDTGVSGSVADSMGEMICEMSKSMQVINITHLPQVAAKGNNHYEVYKKDSATCIKHLSSSERIDKIAEMLSASEVTDAARNQAKILLGY